MDSQTSKHQFFKHSDLLGLIQKLSDIKTGFFNDYQTSNVNFFNWFLRNSHTSKHVIFSRDSFKDHQNSKCNFAQIFIKPQNVVFVQGLSHFTTWISMTL